VPRVPGAALGVAPPPTNPQNGQPTTAIDALPETDIGALDAGVEPFDPELTVDPFAPPVTAADAGAP
jgi:hypothetical protein